MAWRVAKSLEKLRAQINEEWPDRSKASDGTIGNAEHASRSSDHNPWVDGRVVTALDITNDPANGVFSNKIAKALIDSQDPRIKYVISDGQIASSTTAPWTWRPYTGKNSHHHHFHVSVKAEKRFFDDVSSWDFSGATGVAPEAPKGKVAETLSLPLLVEGNKGSTVEKLQTLLNRHGANITVDADFGPKTKKAVVKFQKAAGLVADGKVGVNTWEKLTGV